MVTAFRAQMQIIHRCICSGHDMLSFYAEIQISFGTVWRKMCLNRKQLDIETMTIYFFSISTEDWKKATIREATKKNQQFIYIPINNVDFSKYVEGYAKETYIYDLYAICNHHGQIDGGHYSATIRTSKGKWYNFNDTQVTEILVNDNIISGNTPYCLFYRKKKIT